MISSRKGDIDYEIQLMLRSTKLFHVSLPKEWKEGDKALYGAKFDWDEGGPKNSGSRSRWRKAYQYQPGRPNRLTRY